MKALEIKEKILSFEKELVEYLNSRDDVVEELMELRGVSDVCTNISKIAAILGKEIKEFEDFSKGFKKSAKEKKESRMDALKALLGAGK